MTLIEKPSELDKFWSPVKVVTAENGSDTDVTAENGADTEMQNPFKIKNLVARNASGKEGWIPVEL
jgi:DNA-binding response OmpR family regulator